MKLILIAALCLGLPAFAEESLELRLQSLETQLRELRAPTPFKILRDPSQSRTQLGPVASKIYFDREASWQAGLSTEFFTYQEQDYDRANVLTVAPVLAFRPHRRVIFNSQFLFENGGAESSNTIAYQKGQAVVQMAYLDWLADEAGEAGVRVGHQLVPIGWTNTRQEPVNYLSVLKPELEREMIPSSWHENGVSLWLDRERADFQVGIFNSLNARGYRGDTYLAGGRAQGQNAAANDMMGVFRVNAKNEWFLLGASIAAGNSAQNDDALRNAGFRLAEIHARVKLSRLEIQGMVVQGNLEDAEAVSVYNATAMPVKTRGNSVQAAFNLVAHGPGLWIFARQSDYNLNAEMPIGYAANPALDKAVTTLGLTYFPLPNLVVKSDFQWKSDAAGGRNTELSFGLGAVF